MNQPLLRGGGVRRNTHAIRVARYGSWIAQTRFANAQSAEIRALTEYQIAQVDLAYATGSLLGEAQIYWEANPEKPSRNEGNGK